MTSVVFDGKQDIIGEARDNGFFQVEGFFDPATVAEARAEMAALLDRDLQAREAAGEAGAIHLDQGQFKTALTDKMHTRFFPSWESPTFARMAGDLFSHPALVAFRREVLGEHIRLRIDLIRRASGTNDVVDSFQLPHAWHRDTPGEFTFGIFFDDLDQPQSGGTGVIPGTHMEQLDPRWDLLLSSDGMPLREQFQQGLRKAPDGLFEASPRNREARARVEGATHEIRGRAGDIYFFFNDTWHGRFGNASGKAHMIARIGGFASEFAFKDDIPLPGEGRCLDGRLESLYDPAPPPNTGESVLQAMTRRGSIDPAFVAAAQEKRARLQGLDVARAISDARAQAQARVLAERQAAREKAQAQALAERQAARAAAQAKAVAARAAKRAGALMGRKG